MPSLGVELPLSGSSRTTLHQVGDVVVVGEVGAVAAAALLQLGSRLVEDALAAAAVDARVVRTQVGRVEHPGAVLVGIFEADPLVQVVGPGVSTRTLRTAELYGGASYRRR